MNSAKTKNNKIDHVARYPIPISRNTNNDIGIEYKNTSGRVRMINILVSISGVVGQSATFVLCSGVASPVLFNINPVYINSDIAGNMIMQLTAFIPPNYYYAAFNESSGGGAGVTVAKWVETDL